MMKAARETWAGQTFILTGRGAIGPGSRLGRYPDCGFDDAMNAMDAMDAMDWLASAAAYCHFEYGCLYFDRSTVGVGIGRPLVPRFAELVVANLGQAIAAISDPPDRTGSASCAFPHFARAIAKIAEEFRECSFRQFMGW
ncbi:hypothetical protein [Paraburkholderia antibiotica]|uniref:Uncharacterized protein n=1 Tax=Paraburkholderia antibiotica TaxID=2728839 RepID=A0A7Y0A1W1_9BURK|nr:hypothetical protein [Paraburkholderia antibiotica]NML34995.1 hypothetical protein [Paraburkholderia antibiotica]